MTTFAAGQRQRYLQRMRATLALPRATEDDLLAIEERLGQLSGELAVDPHQPTGRRRTQMENQARDVAQTVLAERAWAKHPILRERYGRVA